MDVQVGLALYWQHVGLSLSVPAGKGLITKNEKKLNKQVHFTTTERLLTSVLANTDFNNQITILVK